MKTLTRERVRQVLAKVTRRMKSAWPAGPDRVAALYEKSLSPMHEPEPLGLLFRSRWLFGGRPTR